MFRALVEASNQLQTARNGLKTLDSNRGSKPKSPKIHAFPCISSPLQPRVDSLEASKWLVFHVGASRRSTAHDDVDRSTLDTLRAARVKSLHVPQG